MTIYKRIFLFSLLCSLFTLSACVPQYETVYSYEPPHSHFGRRCVNACLYDRTNCDEQCQNSEIACRNTADLIVMPEYLRYEQQKIAWNLPINRCPADFADYSNCHYNCGCASTYNECFSNCGGTVDESTQCVAFCRQGTRA